MSESRNCEIQCASGDDELTAKIRQTFFTALGNLKSNLVECLNGKSERIEFEYMTGWSWLGRKLRNNWCWIIYVDKQKIQFQFKSSIRLTYQLTSSQYVSSWWGIESQRTMRIDRWRLSFKNFICQKTIISMLINVILYKLTIQVIVWIDWWRRVNFCYWTEIWRKCIVTMMEFSDSIVTGNFLK